MAATLRVGEDAARRDGDARAVGAQHHGDAAGDQALGRGDGLGLVGLVVHFDQFHLVGLAAHVHRRDDLVGVAHAQHFLEAAAAVFTGHRLEHADFHDVFGEGDSGNDQHEGENQGEYLLHGFPSLQVMPTLYAPNGVFASGNVRFASWFANKPP